MRSRMPSTGYVRLANKYVLRGWKDIPYALEDRTTSKLLYMREDVFRTVQLCNGRFKEDSPVFLGVRQIHLAELARLGILEFLPEPADLAPEQEYLRYDNIRMTRVHWSITGHCNYRCRHCYMSAPHALLPQPSTEECLDIVDQIAECGISRVSLTGGEPLVRRDFLQIVDHILERGLMLDVIMTNGSLVTEELLDALDARGCHPEISMSYDGTEGWHDWLRGVDGAEDQLTRALRLCHERGFVTCIETVLHKGNVHTLRESIRRMGELGVSAVKILSMSCSGEAAALGDYVLSPEEMCEAILEYAPQYVEDGLPVPILSMGGLFNARDGVLSQKCERNPEGQDCSDAVICASARSTMYLGPDGRILPCIPMSEAGASQDYFPLLSSMTLKEALTDSNYMRFIANTLGDYLEHNPSCKECEFKNRCGGGCRGRAVEANGGTDLMGIDPENCLLFKGGYYERGKAIVEELRDRAAQIWAERHARG